MPILQPEKRPPQGLPVRWLPGSQYPTEAQIWHVTSAKSRQPHLAPAHMPWPGALPFESALLTWGQLDLQRSPDEGHQRGCEVDSHVLVGDGHVHANQALGTGT